MSDYYRIHKDKEIIHEIQRYLLSVISTSDNLGITQNGIYDDATKSAVTLFQRKEGLDVTGTVDKKTWDLLWQRHQESNALSEFPDLPEPEVFDIYLGETGYHIIILQTLLGEFSKIYPNTQRPAITGQFGLTTADAVRSMQRNYGMYSDGIVTNFLWNRMLRDHASKKQLLQYSHIFD